MWYDIVTLIPKAKGYTSLKRYIFKSGTFFLAALLIFSNIIPSLALYRGVLGDVYSAESKQIGPGVDFTRYLSVTDGLNESAYLFEYRPDEGALPLISYGEFLYGSNSLSTLAKKAIGDGNNVIGGVNGDFYSVYTGIPMGAVIADGIIISDDDKNNAVGFTDDGEVFFGDPGINFTVIHSYDAPAELSEDVLTEETDAEDPETYEAIKQEELDDASSENEADEAEDEEEISEDTEVEDEAEIEDTAETLREELPVSYFNKYPTEWGAYLLDERFAESTRSTKPSLEIVITLDSPDMFPSANTLMLGTVSEIHSDATNTPILPGTVVISVCETSTYRGNYNNVSVGDRMLISFSVTEGWERVTNAIGGSDIFIENGEIKEEVIDQSHEKIANPRTAIGIREDGTVIIFAVDGRSDESYGLRMISLAKTLLSFGCVTAMNLDGGGSTTVVASFPDSDEITLVNTPSDSAERSVSNALLLVNPFESDGVARYIIPADTAPVILPGEQYVFDGDFYDCALKQVSTDDNFALSSEDVKLDFDLSRLSYYTSDNLPELGEISNDGRTYTASGITGEIPLILTAEHNGELLTGRVLLFVAPAPDSVTVMLASSLLAPKDGLDIEFDAYYMGKPVPSKAEQLTYTLTELEVRTSHTVDENDTTVKLADSSIAYINENGRFIPYSDADGVVLLTAALDGIPVTQSVIACTSPYISTLEETTLSYDFTITDESEDAEDIADKDDTEESVLPLTENIIIENSMPIENALSLDLYASKSDLVINAHVLDRDGSIQKVSYTLEENEPEVNGIYHYRAELNNKYVELTAPIVIEKEANIDKVGELKLTSARASFDDTQTVFYDTYNHWARQNINALYRLGIVGGEQYDNKIRFAPDRSLSRAEFAVIISRSLGYQVEEYSSELEFDDIESIPEWSLPYVRAVSENKIMNGKAMSDGSLNFDAGGSITRQEIMQVIGNIIKKHRDESVIEAILAEGIISEDEAELISEQLEDETAISEVISEDVTKETSSYEMPLFTDAADVSAWAYDNVLLTLEAGIVNGYSDNTLKPLNKVTRAEASTIVLRTLSYLENEFLSDLTA